MALAVPHLRDGPSAIPGQTALAIGREINDKFFEQFP
jgi:hypothetical protein